MTVAAGTGQLADIFGTPISPYLSPAMKLERRNQFERGEHTQVKNITFEVSWSIRSLIQGREDPFGTF